MPTVSIRFRNISFTQHGPGARVLGGIQPATAIGQCHAVEAMPCLDSWQATDTGHLHHNVRLLSRCPALRRHSRYRDRYLLGGAIRANGQDAGQGSHLPGSLGNPWDPLAALLRRLTSRLVWPHELAMLNGQPGKHGVDKLPGKGA